MFTPTGPDPTIAGPMYGSGARRLQDEFDSTQLADTLASVTVHDELDDSDIELIGRQATVWIATVDADGWPDVSYKGGAPGFVTVADRRELRVPIYDGNGMWRTLGNIVDDGRVAVLFVDVERPWRIRIHGRATVTTTADDVAGHPGAQAVVVVRIGRIFPNCGRYIHRGDEISPFVPSSDGTAPIPDWKRIGALRDVLPARDRDALDADDGTTDGHDGSSGPR